MKASTDTAVRVDSLVPTRSKYVGTYALGLVSPRIFKAVVPKMLAKSPAFDGELEEEPTYPAYGRLLAYADILSKQLVVAAATSSAAASVVTVEAVEAATASYVTVASYAKASLTSLTASAVATAARFAVAASSACQQGTTVALAAAVWLEQAAAAIIAWVKMQSAGLAVWSRFHSAVLAKKGVYAFEVTSAKAAMLAASAEALCWRGVLATTMGINYAVHHGKVGLTRAVAAASAMLRQAWAWTKVHALAPLDRLAKAWADAFCVELRAQWHAFAAAMGTYAQVQLAARQALLLESGRAVKVSATTTVVAYPRSRRSMASIAIAQTNLSSYARHMLAGVRRLVANPSVRVLVPFAALAAFAVYCFTEFFRGLFVAVLSPAELGLEASLATLAEAAAGMKT